jgi:ABC-type nitrate/sulfonate/bicarbonate transport system ATPase subunit
MIAGLEKPDSGLIEGIEGKKTAFLFQDDRLFPWLTALQNVEAVITDKSRLPLARQILTELGLGSEKDLRSYPSELSGGMLRRVAIARTLAYGADVLIFDEALRGLDVANIENTVAVIKKYTAALTLISVTHTPSDIEAEAENLICV